MKRTLTISLWLALGASAVAQNPAVMQKNVQTAVKASASTQATGAAAKPSPTTVKVVAVTASKRAVVVAKPVAVAVKPSTVQAKATAKPTAAVQAVKPVAVAVPAVKAQGSAPAARQAVVAKSPQTNGTTKAAPMTKADPFKSAKTNGQSTPAMKAESAKVVAVDKTSERKKPLATSFVKPVGQSGRRDPFISPVVTMSAVGSGCSSGKRCLAIDQIALRGVVRSDNGMIAVVVNAAAKAYFLRENDPVFNGYVVKITGDSIVFKETFHDKLGKSLTRDITKTINRPVA
jgi:Tfp pilus assembly protein PilP